MIGSFSNKLARDLVEEQKSKETRSFPAELHRIARKKLAMVHAARDVVDLRVPPGNRLERLKGDFKGFYSIRINDQWRVIFKWSTAGPEQVQIMDYHK